MVEVFRVERFESFGFRDKGLGRRAEVGFGNWGPGRGRPFSESGRGPRRPHIHRVPHVRTRFRVEALALRGLKALGETGAKVSFCRRPARWVCRHMVRTCNTSKPPLLLLPPS